MQYLPFLCYLTECINNTKTFVDDVFGGSLASTIVCSQCKTVWHLLLLFMGYVRTNDFDRIVGDTWQKSVRIYA